jgi:hypothetical protein
MLTLAYKSTAIQPYKAKENRMTIYSRQPPPQPESRRWRRIAAALETGDDAMVARRLGFARAHVALVRAVVAAQGAAVAAPAEAHQAALKAPRVAEPQAAPKAPPVEVLPAPDLRQPWERARDAYLVLIAREADELERYLLRYRLLQAIQTPYKEKERVRWSR